MKKIIINSVPRQIISGMTWLLAVLMVLPAERLHAAELPRLTTNMEVAQAGFFKLSWQQGIGAVEIEEAMNRDFNKPIKLYPGSDNATVVSGKPDGEWYYRARTVSDGHAGDWSNVVQVTVAHHSLQRALIFFMAGFVMFVATCWLVIRGERLA